MVRRDGERVRCFTRGGYDRADRFPAIVEAASRVLASSFMIDGEAVIANGTPDFHALRSKRRGHEAVLAIVGLPCAGCHASMPACPSLPAFAPKEGFLCRQRTNSELKFAPNCEARSFAAMRSLRSIQGRSIANSEAIRQPTIKCAHVATQCMTKNEREI
jgi:hypothetical protein